MALVALLKLYRYVDVPAAFGTSELGCHYVVVADAWEEELLGVVDYDEGCSTLSGGFAYGCHG